MQSKKIIWPCNFQQEILVILSADLMKICRFLHVKNRIWFLFLVKKNMTGGYTPFPFQRLNGRSLRSAIICILIQCYKGYEFLVFISTFSNSVWVNTDLPHSLDKLYHIMSALEGIDVKIIMLICKTVLY